MQRKKGASCLSVRQAVRPRNSESSHERQRKAVVFDQPGREPVVATRHDQNLWAADQTTELVGRAGF